MDECGEADTNEHRDDDGDWGETHSALHDKWHKQVIFTPLNDVVDTCNDECPDWPFLCESNEHGRHSCNDWSDVGDELCECSESSECDRVIHAEDGECNEDECPDCTA